MTIQEELKEVFFETKRLISACQEMGLEPPKLPKGALDFIEHRPDEKKRATPAPPVATPERARAQTASPSLSPSPSPFFDSLTALRDHIGDCHRCNLHRGRKNLVFGEGDEKARLVFVGEGPGFDEDQTGRPFVGKAGELLTRIIENGMGLTRDQVYICNVVKCRPPGNRDPNPDEIDVCLPFLKAQLGIIKPEVICVLGRVAGEALLGGGFRITRDRGRWRTFEDIPLMPTFHPAYLLRNPGAKRPVWDDVKSIMGKLGLKVQS